ncbi:hypothetical protein J6590_068331 [Homalodisca vitripennis]|nr:hypothetical protein J6590_068331 [Homalodisca vitripennis]
MKCLVFGRKCQHKATTGISIFIETQLFDASEIIVSRYVRYCNKTNIMVPGIPLPTAGTGLFWPVDLCRCFFKAAYGLWYVAGNSRNCYGFEAEICKRLRVRRSKEKHWLLKAKENNQTRHHYRLIGPRGTVRSVCYHLCFYHLCLYTICASTALKQDCHSTRDAFVSATTRRIKLVFPPYPFHECQTRRPVSAINTIGQLSVTSCSSIGSGILDYMSYSSVHGKRKHLQQLRSHLRVNETGFVRCRRFEFLGIINSGYVHSLFVRGDVLSVELGNHCCVTPLSPNSPWSRIIIVVLLP